MKYFLIIAGVALEFLGAIIYDLNLMPTGATSMVCWMVGLFTIGGGIALIAHQDLSK